MVKRIPSHLSFSDVGYVIVVDYNVSIEALLKKGNYTQVSPEINETIFPTLKGGKKEIIVKIIKLNRRPVIGDPEFEKEMAVIYENGYEAVNLQELLTAFRYIENRSSILALGSIIDIDDSLMSPFVRKGGYQGNIIGLEPV